MRGRYLIYIGIALIILIGVLYVQNSEGFEDAVPSYCGSAGYAPSPALLRPTGISNRHFVKKLTHHDC